MRQHFRSQLEEAFKLDTGGNSLILSKVVDDRHFTQSRSVGGALQSQGVPIPKRKCVWCYLALARSSGPLGAVARDTKVAKKTNGNSTCTSNRCLSLCCNW